MVSYGFGLNETRVFAGEPEKPTILILNSLNLQCKYTEFTDQIH